jgi:hypothetical protein
MRVYVSMNPFACKGRPRCVVALHSAAHAGTCGRTYLQEADLRGRVAQVERQIHSVPRVRVPTRVRAEHARAVRRGKPVSRGSYK